MTSHWLICCHGREGSERDGSVLPNRWRFGVVRMRSAPSSSFGRVQLPIGEAFRIEMTSPDEVPTPSSSSTTSPPAGARPLLPEPRSRGDLRRAIQDIAPPPRHRYRTEGPSARRALDLTPAAHRPTGPGAGHAPLPPASETPPRIRHS